jgi:hypothetical protein
MRQGAHEPIEAITGPCVWRGEGLARKDDWIVRVGADVLDELAGTVAEARRRGEDSRTIDLGRRHPPGIASLAGRVRAALSDGYGFCLLRGVPADRFTVDELKMLLLALGDQIGLIGPQEQGPRTIGEVMDTGPDTPKDFYYHRGGALPMHMDPIDVVGLMCVRAAKTGGASGIASAMTVHNEMLRERPDLLRILYQGFRRLRRHRAEDRGRNLLTDAPVPVFADIGGDETVCTFLTEAVYAGVRAGLMSLSEAEQDAIWMMERTAERPDVMLAMDLQPGDIQLLNNRVILHNRSDYEDYPDPARRRLMLRLWLSMPGWRKFPESIPHLDVETGRLPE